MSSRAILITGAMRSGTSLVAEIVNRLGWHAAILIPTPGPPSWRSDWEDASLTEKLILREPIDWAAWFKERRRVSKLAGFGGQIALKSPYLVFHWEEIEKVEKDPIWIEVTREPEARDRSFAHQKYLSSTDQEMIIWALEGLGPDIQVSYEALVYQPEFAVPALAVTLGVTDESAVQAAAELVGEPTEYPCLQSLPR